MRTAVALFLGSVSFLFGGALVLAAPSALAGTIHPFLSSFDGGETPAGAFGLASGAGVSESSHNVYVQDAFGVSEGVGAIDVFNGGHYVSQITAGAAPQGGFSFANPGAVAIDESATATKGRVYVADENHSVVDAFGPTGTYLFQLDGSNTPAGSFAFADGVAVDASGNVYVSDFEHGVIDKFDSAGAYLTQISGAEVGAPSGLAIDGMGDLYAIVSRGVLEINPLGQPQGLIGSGGAVALATDTVSNDLYVANGNSVSEYDSLGSLVSHFGASFIGQTSGIAVDGSTGEIFVADAQRGVVSVFGPAASAPEAVTGGASTPDSAHAMLEGTVNPSSGTLPASYQFQYGTSGSYGEVAPATPTSIGTGLTPQQESVSISGLQPNTTYHYRIVASNTNGPVEGEDATFTTPGPPGITAESVSRITASEARLNATLNPNNAETHYYFQYGLDQNYSSGTVPVPPGGSVGAGGDAEAVSQRISGLEPGSEYHYRVVAVSVEGTEFGADQRFSTFPLSSSVLPDDRAYELVSPVNKEGDGVYSVGGFSTPGHQVGINQSFQSSLDGDSMTYSGSSSSAGNGLLGNEYLATRGASGWSASDISPPTAGPSPQCVHPLITTAPYSAFSADLTVGVLVATGTSGLPLGSGPCYVSLLLRDNLDSAYLALTNGEPPNRNPREFGFGLPEPTSPPNAAYMFAGASTDFSKTFFAANDTLASPAVDGGETENNLYESSAGALSLVNVLPDGTTEPDATFGTTLGLGPQEPPNYEHAISTDGSRAYWTDLSTNNPIGTSRLFLREGSAPSVWVDAPQGGSGNGGGGHFWTASADGSRVIFTDGSFRGLTSNTLPSSLQNLYAYDANTRKLTDLTGNQEHADVLGVVGASEDGSYVYFVSEGVLVSGAGEEFQPNLYVAHEGTISFIATLSPEDNSNAQGGDSDAPRGDWRADPAYRTAGVTPDGKHLVFQSLKNELTGYPNAGQTEVYVYDAEARKLACASCNPTGTSPSGPSVLRPLDAEGHQPRWITDDGSRVFFDSSDALTLGDTNGTWDVYEYEGGSVHLISGGTSGSGSYFDDASPTGGNVFFTTREQLAPEDRDELTDLYDARVGGGFPNPSTAAPCTGEGCRAGQSVSPVLPTAASAAFGGFTESPAVSAKAVVRAKVLSRAQKLAKALKVCRAKRRQRRRAQCETRARKQYGSLKQAKRKRKATR